MKFLQQGLLHLVLLPPANEVLGQANIFTPVCHSVHRGGIHGCSQGACMVALGGFGGCLGGHAWLLWGVCMVALGVYVVPPGGSRLLPGGHAWLLLGGHAWLLRGGMCGCSGGACMVAPGGPCLVAPGGVHGCSGGGMHGIWRDTEMRSMTGRYASYWNAFLFKLYIDSSIPGNFALIRMWQLWWSMLQNFQTLKRRSQ